MTLELFRAMMREEWRIHSSLFGSAMFLLFPFVLAAFSFAGSFFLPVLSLIVPLRTLALLVHSTFFLFGASVGSFGLLGREVLNRRFGHASLVAFSSRSLPVSEREILTSFVVKDCVYYLALWVFPFVLGFAAASLAFYPIVLHWVPLVLLTLSLSFLFGLSVVFLLSTIYVRLGKFAAVLAPGVIVAAAVALRIPAETLLPPFLLLLGQDPFTFVLSTLLILVPYALSVAFLEADYAARERRHRERLAGAARGLGFARNLSFLVAKDLLDLYRSEGGFGKVLFTLLLPLGLTSAILSVFLKFIPSADFLLIFSIFLGVISSSIYNWLTEFDMASAYGSTLPLKSSDVMRGKVFGYLLLSPLSPLLLLAVAIARGSPLASVAAALFALAGTCAYSLAITALLGGLAPNILLYNAKNFLLYFALIAPVSLVAFFLSLSSAPGLAAFCAFLLPVSLVFLRKAYRRADSSEALYF